MFRYLYDNCVTKIIEGGKEMKKKAIWLVISCLMVLSLAVASCSSNTTSTGGQVTNQDQGQTVTSGGSTSGGSVTTSGGTTTGGSSSTGSSSTGTATTTTSNTPQYGGTLTCLLTSDPLWDLISFGATWPQEMSHQRLVDGDWTKGPAGGYGEDLTDWGQSTNVPSFNTGVLASDYSWKISANGSDVISTYTVRKGVYFANVPSAAGKMVGGREMTIDDVVFTYNLIMHNENAQNWQLYPGDRYPEAVKTGPDTFQVVHKLADFMGASMRENLCDRVIPPELWNAYGYDAATQWQNDVGTGPYMITDYVAGNLVDLKKNPDYWGTDPIGPGKGNQLPYADELKFIIIQDTSTQQAALRSGKMDVMNAVYPEDQALMSKTDPDLQYATRGSWSHSPIFMNTSEAPFNNVKVRQAMMMATNFDDINNSLYSGQGEIISWPYFDVKGYEPLVVHRTDADLPQSTKDLYSYNPDKAKQLLADAGYPNGFKTTLDLVQTDVDYYSILQSYWSQVGIDFTLNISPDPGSLIGQALSIDYDMIAIFTSPNSSYPEQSLYAARNWVNASLINDPQVDATAEKVREQAITDFQGSMETARPMIIGLLAQAYCIPTPRVPTYSMWQPWIKNYSGEVSIGYWGTFDWTQYVWVDQAMKTKMGR